MSYTEEQVLNEIQNFITQYIEAFNINKKKCVIKNGRFLMESTTSDRYNIKYNLQYSIEYFIQYELISISNFEFCLFFDCYPKDIKIRIELLTSFDVEDELFLDKLKPFFKHIKEMKKMEVEILNTLKKLK